MADLAALPSPRQRLDTCLELLGAAAGRPQQFLSVQDGLAADFVALTKALYDFHHALRGEAVAGSPLEELVVENFDEEQIWQQLELQNHAVLGSLKKAVARNVEDEGKGVLSLLPDIEEEEEAEDGEEEMDLEDQAEKESSCSSGHSEEEEEEELDQKRSNLEASKTGFFSDEDSELDFDIDKLEKQIQKSKNVRKKTGTDSLVDDRFFKLSEMEAALEAEEKEGNRGSDSEGIDYFEEILSEDEEEEEEFGTMKKKAIKSARDLKYQDYFDPVDESSGPLDEEDRNSQSGEGGEEEEEEEEEGSVESTPESAEVLGETRQIECGKSKDLSKRVTFSLPFDSDVEEEADPLQGKSNKPPEMKSSFEKRQEKMSEKIKSLEEELLKEKPWQLKGEIAGQRRPENSLLQEMLLFDHAVRMAPMVTEETTLELEEIIKRRIKDQAWDDVVRKEKPKEDPFEYKKRLTLDQEKSKLSLAEIYEQEYLKLNQKKTEEEEKPEHVEIQKMMDSLFVKLDALSNFHFMPKPPVPEVKVVSNLPAITMEEVAPVHISDAALLAPEEIKKKNKGGDVKTDAEKTPADKKRDRRKKKLVKRMRLKERERRQKLLEKKSEASAKLSKKGSEAQLEKLTKERGTSLLKDDGREKALKSSKAFFSQLQDQVKMQIRETKKSQKRPKKQELSAQKLKL
ncbi:U3 small nucleolar ribonucleoprotein protein MPP10 [Protobothrops mucrosquamatus]|uniref:U3 small nucleolar ribonucleoprotein protein MPP10 n=1 Tax=Protobothrops mucrosquamatus TaxID=103944 RepID=UPI000775B97E|nr:U3 small nucleolar ribonucleoprotein protein MPP10 [Protobothrops mucrosquamatus]